MKEQKKRTEKPRLIQSHNLFSSALSGAGSEKTGRMAFKRMFYRMFSINFAKRILPRCRKDQSGSGT